MFCIGVFYIQHVYTIFMCLNITRVKGVNTYENSEK